MRASYPAAFEGDAAGVEGADAGFALVDFESDDVDSDDFGSDGFESDEEDDDEPELSDDLDVARESLR
jgi:hypothetical protein